MPWDGSELWVGAIDPDGSVATATLVAGGSTESIAGPAWAPDGSLVFASDRSGWWNLYRWRPGMPGIEPLAPMEAEFAVPQWVFGQRQIGFDGRGGVVAIARSRGRDQLLVLDPGQPPRPIELDATDLHGLSVSGDTAVLVASGPTRPTAVLRIDLATGAIGSVRTSSVLAVDGAYLSQPRFVEFPTTGDRTAFAFHYPPTNPDAIAPDGEQPPLLVISHGGPTSNTDIPARPDHPGLHQSRLRGAGCGLWRQHRLWPGIPGPAARAAGASRCSDDCTNAATWLAGQGLADPARLTISGGSAGGYTTLCALTFRDVFAAGASHFGVGDLAALARDTHKFESRYLDLLVAPWPDGVAVYDERSPVHFVDRVRTPVLVLQGADDRVVPQAQADDLVAALARNKVPYAYILFQGEGHGFRRAENRRRSLEAELSFYAQVLGFQLADAFDPVEVVGLGR